MKSKIIYRAILDIVIFISIIYGYWPIALVVGVLNVWLCNAYLEFIFAGIFYDLLFGVFGRGYLYGLLATVISIISSIIIHLARKVLRR